MLDTSGKNKIFPLVPCFPPAVSLLKWRMWGRWATELLWQPPEEYICGITEMLCVWNVSYCILLEIKLLLRSLYSLRTLLSDTSSDYDNRTFKIADPGSIKRFLHVYMICSMLMRFHMKCGEIKWSNLGWKPIYMSAWYKNIIQNTWWNLTLSAETWTVDTLSILFNCVKYFRIHCNNGRQL